MASRSEALEVLRHYPVLRRRLEELKRHLAVYEERREEIIERGMGIALDTQSHLRAGSSSHSDSTARKGLLLSELDSGAQREYVRLARVCSAVEAVLPPGSEQRTLIDAWYWQPRGGRVKASMALSVSERTVDRWRDKVVAALAAQLPDGE